MQCAFNFYWMRKKELQKLNRLFYCFIFHMHDDRFAYYLFDFSNKFCFHTVKHEKYFIKNDEDIRIRRKGHIKLRRNGLKHESPQKKMHNCENVLKVKLFEFKVISTRNDLSFSKVTHHIFTQRDCIRLCTNNRTRNKNSLQITSFNHINDDQQ